MKRLALAALVVIACSQPRATPDAASAPSTVPHSAAQLMFARNGTPLATLTLDQLRAIAPPEDLTSFDPYYQRVKHFRVIPIEPVLARAFGADATHPLTREQFVLRARDGYTVPIAGERLLEGGACIAIADLDVPAWEPIGQQHANPGPFYLVWRHPTQQDLEAHPRPWQLASIEIAPFASVFPHTVPEGEPDNSAAQHGFAIFRNECIRCHAINREGGRVGPELNVPQSIVEYRPEAQIRAYIRNPLTFRYGSMPPHPTLTDDDLGALIAYFHAMSLRKHDPDAHPSDGGSP